VATTISAPRRSRDGERPVGELVERLRLSQPSVSKHLRVLKEAGLVEARAEARRRLSRIRPQPLAELDGWLAPYHRLWMTHLDRLQSAAYCAVPAARSAFSVAERVLGEPR
jgi:DNA-binding transcriptional ArsR family regulator